MADHSPGKTANSGLPPLYARWTAPLLGGPIPPETEATCQDCAMCATAGAPAHAAGSYFSPNTKCCTYLPRLANFTVGEILADTDPANAAGRSTLDARLQRGEMVRPLGLGIPPGYGARYEHASTDFGTSPALLCPHFLPDGRCGIWRYRNGVCTTWFCKHVRGAVGLRFWHALEGLLSSVEQMLACWCLLDQDFGPTAFDQLSPATANRQRPPYDTNLAGTLEPAAYRSLWGKWAGLEREFYERCAQQVESLDWADILRIGGPDITARAHIARSAYDALTDCSLPRALTVGQFRVIGIDESGTQVEGYHGSDPLRLSSDLMDVLPLFNGRPTTETLRSLADDRGIGIAPELVRKLTDFEILVPVEGKNEATRTAHTGPGLRS